MSFRELVRPVAHRIGLQPRAPAARIAHASIGAIAGIFLTAFMMRLWWGTSLGTGFPLLVAPMGASAVLLFAVPASPLAQPWAIIGGNTISALSGILWAKLIGDPTYAAGLAVGTAILAMSLARCLHPPGGAVALTSVIGGHAIIAAGWSFAFLPVALNCMLLVAIGWLYNAASHGNYPHHAKNFTTTVDSVGYTMADLESVLAQYDELLDVSSEDLDSLFRQVEARAYRRLHGVIQCAQIMQRGVATTTPAATLASVGPLYSAGRDHSLPVVGSDGHVEGLLTVNSLTHPGDMLVSQVMISSPCLASPETPIDELLPILSGGKYREAMIVDRKSELLGLITQTDLLSALWRGHIAEEIARIPA